MNILRPILILTLSLASILLADAHAFLNDADPKVGSTLQESPRTVKIWFTSHLRSGLSTLEVFDDKNREVDKQDSRVDGDDPTLLTVSVPRLVVGTYHVAWKAVCIDSHTTHGSFSFTVAAR